MSNKTKTAFHCSINAFVSLIDSHVNKKFTNAFATLTQQTVNPLIIFVFAAQIKTAELLRNTVANADLTLMTVKAKTTTAFVLL